MPTSLRNTNLAIKSRKILTSDTIYYVDRTTGNDANTGEENAPFATIQKALDLIDRNLDLGGYALTIQVAAGDYTTEGLLHLPVITGGKAETCTLISSLNAQINLVGSGETTVIAGFELDHHAYYSIENIKLQSSGYSPYFDAITSQRGGIIELKNIYFEGSNYESSCLNTLDNGIIYLRDNFVFDGSWALIFKASNSASIKISTNQSCYLNFSYQIYILQSFIEADNMSFINLRDAIFNTEFGNNAD